MNDITRDHEVFGRFIHFRPKAPEQVFIDVAHHSVGYRVWMEVDVGKILADLEQDFRFFESDHGVAEVEPLENDPCIVGKLGDGVLKILASLGASEVPREYSEVL